MLILALSPWLIGLVVIALFLLSIRYLGQHTYPIVKQTIPEQPPLPSTTLGQATEAILYKLERTEASVIYPIDSDRLAMLTRIHLADHAEQTLDLQYYLFHDDEAGQAVLQASVEAAERGVKVRLLLDDMGMAGRDGYLGRLAREIPNLAIYLFNPFYLRSFRIPEYPARFPPVTRRMHNKAYLVDNIIGIVGGRNIGNDYFDVYTKIAFADYDVMIAGKAVEAITTSFNEYWYSGLTFNMADLGKSVADHAYQNWRASLKFNLEKYRNAVEQYQDVVDDLMASYGKLPYPADVAVVYDPPYKIHARLFDRDPNYLSNALLQLMESAQQEIWISSPYFIPGKEGMDLFKRLRQRQVEIHILTNTFAANDVAIVHASYMRYRKPLLELGIHLYELKAPLAKRQSKEHNLSLLGSKRSSLHAKFITVDRQRNFVGSFNLDPRSAVHNTEMGVIFTNADYGAMAVERLQEYVREQAYELVLSEDGGLEWVSYDDTGVTRTKHEPSVHLWQKAMFKVLGILPISWLL